MLQLEVFVGKLFTVDRLAAGAVAVREIASLTHELRNDAVKRTAFVAKPFFAGAQGAKILGQADRHFGLENQAVDESSPQEICR